MNRAIPKFNLLQLSLYMADLLLVSEGSETSVREPKVRIVWHTFLFSVVAFAVITLLFHLLFKSHFLHSAFATTIWRFFVCFSHGYFIALLFFLAHRHYVYLLRTGIDLRFQQIVFFYFLAILLFAQLYGDLFFLSPQLFDYPRPVVTPLPLLMDLGLMSYAQLADFIVYSACVAVSVNYPRITSGSWVISVFNVLQVLYGLVMIVIFISTFIQKVDKGKKQQRLT